MQKDATAFSELIWLSALRKSESQTVEKREKKWKGGDKLSL